MSDSNEVFTDPRLEKQARRRFNVAEKKRLLTEADIYRSRWEVELFLKSIKRGRKIRSFRGRSMEAVASQIFVALCVYLLVAFQKFVSRSAMGIQAVIRLVQLNLSQRRPLADLLRGRKHDPPDPQMPLRLRAA